MFTSPQSYKFQISFLINSAKRNHCRGTLNIFSFPCENGSRMLSRAVAAVFAPCVIPAVLLWPRRQAELQVAFPQEGLTFMTEGFSVMYYEWYQGNNQNCTKNTFKFLYCLFLCVSEITQEQFSCFGQSFFSLMSILG